MTRILSVPRTLTLIVLALVFTILGALPAHAHTTNLRFHTRLVSVEPTLPGVSITVADNGEWVRLTNTSVTPVVMYGYEKEPYLRIGPDGVWQNMLSPSTYLNQSLQIGTIPESVDPKAPPRWVRPNTSKFASWHDHRVHWMGAGLPPVVAKDMGSAHLVDTWTIRAVQDRTAITITGTLSWRPVSGFFYLVTIPILVTLLLGVAVLVVLRMRNQRLGVGPATGRPRERANVDA